MSIIEPRVEEYKRYLCAMPPSPWLLNLFESKALLLKDQVKQIYLEAQKYKEGHK